VVLIGHVEIDAAAQQLALRSEVQRRGLVLPERFDAPDRRLWEFGYAAEARRARRPVASTLDAALGVVRPFLHPLLQQQAAGTWDARQRRWRGAHHSDSDDDRLSR
jgi:hypothetical protein